MRMFSHPTGMIGLTHNLFLKYVGDFIVSLSLARIEQWNQWPSLDIIDYPLRYGMVGQKCKITLSEEDFRKWVAASTIFRFNIIREVDDYSLI